MKHSKSSQQIKMHSLRKITSVKSSSKSNLMLTDICKSLRYSAVNKKQVINMKEAQGCAQFSVLLECRKGGETGRELLSFVLHHSGVETDPE